MEGLTALTAGQCPAAKHISITNAVIARERNCRAGMRQSGIDQTAQIVWGEERLKENYRPVRRQGGDMQVDQSGAEGRLARFFGGNFSVQMCNGSDNIVLLG